MIVVAVDGAAVATIIRPGNITHGVLTVGDLIAIDDLAHAVDIARATDLIPGVVGLTVAVDVLGNHHDAGFVHTAEDEVFHLLIGIAPDSEIALAREVGDGMVEVEGDVTSPATKRHHMGALIIASQILCTLPYHIVLRVAFLVFRGIIDVLSWCRTVFVDRLDIF